MTEKRPIGARKTGKLEGQKIVGVNVDSTDARCYVELTRANGKVEKIEVHENYSVRVYGDLVSRPHGSGE